ncbi:MAG: ABC transporter permease [Chloroflexota bacterium]
MLTSTRGCVTPEEAAPARRRPPFPFGAVGLLGSVALLALGADVIAPGDPLRTVGPALRPPGPPHWFGTDDLGRDVLAMVAHGARTSLMVGAAAALMAAAVGTLVGGVSGYFGGLIDDILTRLTEFFQVTPRFFLATLAVVLFGSKLWLIVAVVGLTFWPAPARILRSQVLALRVREFVLAARALGAPEAYILVRHVLPNALGPVVVTAALQVGWAILTEASLSFLGLGDRNVPGWGQMLSSAQPFIRTAWWLSVFPGLVLLATVLGVNLLADWVNLRLDPRLGKA